MTDWSVGDLAVCVDDGPPRISLKIEGRRLVAALKVGRTYRVREVTFSTRGPEIGALCLKLEGFDYRVDQGEYAGHDARRFRKIRPDEQSGELSDWELLMDAHTRKVRA